MKNYTLWTIVLIGVIFIIQAVILSLTTNFNVGNILEFVAGLLLFSYGMYSNKLPENSFVKIIKYTTAGGIAVSITIMLFVAIYGSIDTVEFNEDAVIVLGAGIHGERVTVTLKQRLDKCVSYAQKNPDAIIVVSGGQGPQERITEALAMERYLISKSIPPERIIKEERSTSTSTNFLYSKQILDRHFDGTYTVTVITNNFHSYRAAQMAKKLGLNATRYNAGLLWYITVPTYLRELLAVMAMWVIK